MAIYEKLVIQDLNELVNEAEVIEAIGQLVQADTKGIRIVRSFAVVRGMRWMVVSMPPELSNKALEEGKIRVGIIDCRVKRWIERRSGRCPRCLVGGHLAKDCTGPDRRQDCRGCGVTGHHEAVCTASTEDICRFKQLLIDEQSAIQTQNYKDEKSKKQRRSYN